MPNSTQEDIPPFLGPYNPDKHNKKDGKHPPHNILAPFGLDENGNPTDRPLPGPVVVPYEKDTSAIPGPPYIEHGQHHKTFGFKTSKDEGIHGPPPFIVKPTKEDFDKKHKYPDPTPETNKKTKTKNKGEFKPTVPPLEGHEDYDEAGEVGQFPHFRPDQPHIIYVNHPINLPPHLPPGGRPLPNEIFQNQNDPNFYHPLFHPDPKGDGKPPHPQDRRPLPVGLYDGDEEAVLHYHSPDLPDDPRILAKEILDHLRNGVPGVPDQAFGAQRPLNSTNFAVPHPNNTG